MIGTQMTQMVLTARSRNSGSAQAGRTLASAVATIRHSMKAISSAGAASL